MRKIVTLVLCLPLWGCGMRTSDQLGELLASAQSQPQAQISSAPVSTIDPKDFLVPWVCEDGRLEIADPGCNSRPMTSSEPQMMRVHDLPAPNGPSAGYQVGGGWMMKGRPDHYVSPFSYKPWKEQRLPDDGGEVYVVKGNIVRILLTQDGSKPFIQVFQGPECGGDGWLLWVNTELKPGQWSQRIARLAIGQVGQKCKSLGPALTRYRLEYVNMTVLVDDQPVQRRVKTIIVQHYDHNTVSKSQQLEEFYFGEHIGRYRWSAYTTKARPASAELAMRCPPRAYTGDSDARFKLSDCRDLTNYRTADGSMSGDLYDWPKGPIP
jgi:hypothetical protein